MMLILHRKVNVYYKSPGDTLESLIELKLNKVKENIIMANRTKPKQKKLWLSEEKAAVLDSYLKSNNIKLQDLLEDYIDKVLEKNEK